MYKLIADIMRELRVFVLLLLAASLPRPSHLWDMPVLHLNRRKKHAPPLHADASSTGKAKAPPFEPPPAPAPNHKNNGKKAAGPKNTLRYMEWLPPSGAALMNDFRQTLWSILLYKPPIGATAFLVFLRLFFGRSSNLYLPLVIDEAQMETANEVSAGGKRRRRKRRKGRSLDLDASDRSYDDDGGVEAVRAQLCTLALNGIIASSSSPHEHGSNELAVTTGKDDKKATNAENIKEEERQKELLMRQQKERDHLRFQAVAALDALKVSCPPRGSREDFVERMAAPLALLWPVLSPRPGEKEDRARGGVRQRRWKRGGKNADESVRGDDEKVDDEAVASRIVREAAKVAEVRALDALLRILRDRLLASSARLRRAERHWSFRVHWFEEGFGRGYKKWIRKTFRRATLEDDRRNLALASAAFERESRQLGEVQKVLLERPPDMQSSALLAVTARNGLRTSLSSEGDEAVMSDIAIDLLLGDDCGSDSENGERSCWVDEANAWTIEVRSVICDAIASSMYGLAPTEQSSPDRKRDATVEQDTVLLHGWCAYEGKHDDADSWKSVLSLVDNLAKARRVGEKRYLIVSDVKAFARRFDVLGIPSSLVIVCAAILVQNAVQPYWPAIVDWTQKVWKAVWGIIEFRFYLPLRDIVLDLLNRRPRMLDPYQLANEETSLDNMLRDLGVGDGTSAGRAEAVAAASRMYEEELQTGPLRGVFRGHLVKLLLIQVQQLKAGLLKAMVTIDDLVDANRLNVQLLASIPAVLLVTLGTRVFYNFLYSLRTRDIRPIRDVHAEMSEYLDKMERCLLLANHDSDFIVASAPNSTDSQSTIPTEGGELQWLRRQRHFLQSKELGEFVLLAHSYLVLLDYCNPPFPTRACDAIHYSMQDLLLEGQLSTIRQLDMLRLIRSNHANLIKSLRLR